MTIRLDLGHLQAHESFELQNKKSHSIRIHKGSIYLGELLLYFLSEVESFLIEVMSFNLFPQVGYFNYGGWLVSEWLRLSFLSFIAFRMADPHYLI